MVKYIIKRLLMLIPVIIGITLLIFVIMSVAPSNIAALTAGADATAADIAAKEHELGLDRPILVQYASYMGNLLRGDFGVSWLNGYRVMDEFAMRLPNTIKLGIFAMIIATVISIPLGILAAVHQYGVLDICTLVGSMVLASIPAFWLGLLLQLLFCIRLGLLPATGSETSLHFILPAIALAALHTAWQTRSSRTYMLETIKQDYIRTARAKGASEFRVITRHALRNAMIHILTTLGSTFASLLGGTVVIETVFGIAGTGSMLISAVKVRDTPVVMGVIVVISLFVGCVNLLVDLLYAAVDPRVKLGYIS